MDGGRGELEPPASVKVSPSAAKAPRANRLSRSFRITQAAPVDLDSPRSQPLPEFKTPTRIPRSKPAAASCGESPQDSDLQHDIIWDATSPPPRRPGKRSKRHVAGVTNISEIVSRIAPKCGRPLAAEPTLQRWIGDSAAIPSTPDLQDPRPKRRSPRLNGVDDLLRLAKRFDLTLYHRDEEEEEDHLDILDHQDKRPAVSGTSMRLDLDLSLEDDLDFLFDGPTQPVDGDLSQVLSQNRPIDGSGKPPKTPLGSVSSVLEKDPSAGRYLFQDDWDDDLLNDSLVLEMTQNPLDFMVPKVCSAQKPAGVLDRTGPVSSGEAAGPASAVVWVGPSDGTKTEKENLRSTLRLQPNSPLRRVQSHPRTDRHKDLQTPEPQPSRSSADSRPPRTELTCRSEAGPRRSHADPRSSAGSSSSALRTDPTDWVWGDPVDDDLLCEMCDDLENRIQNPNTNQRAALQPTHRTCENPVQTGAEQVRSSRSAPPRNTNQHFSFKRPDDLVTMATGKRLDQRSAKCSAAEIELKRQQAVERRRRRLQEVQNRPRIT